MNIVKNHQEITALAVEAKRAGRTVGLVPTMGALHEGHISLVEKCRSECDLVVVSIYVNPTQFGEGEDFGKYPRDLEADAAKCERAGADVIFAPSNETMYLPGHSTWVEVGELGEVMCGMSRPGHFRGVTTIVSKLFNICQPDRAYFGQKDLQQLVIIKRMTRDLNFPVKIVPMPIFRAEDGLALSSRNEYLNEEERRAAVCLHAALERFREMVEEGERDANTLLEAMAETVIAEPTANLDYAVIVDSETLEDVQGEIRGKVAAALAVWFGGTRLIDNIMVSV